MHWIGMLFHEEIRKHFIFFNKYIELICHLFCKFWFILMNLTMCLCAAELSVFLHVCLFINSSLHVCVCDVSSVH